jgi:phytoene dehydrogenase-like protein
MSRTVAIVGAGMGGLTAALRLARHGIRVQVFEARSEPGGLASATEIHGFRFDAGPYILLDRPGLEWAFHAVDLELAEHIPLQRIEDIYEVVFPDGTTAHFLASLEKTAAGLDRLWPGSGRSYELFVTDVTRVYHDLQRLLHVSRPRWHDLLRGGAWRHVPFLMRPLGSVLARSGLPAPVQEAVAIWTHVAGQRTAAAPSPLAFVPALIHSVGAFYPLRGISAIPRLLAEMAKAAGVEFHYQTKVRAIRCNHGRISGLETEADKFVGADAIISNASGVGTYLELVAATPTRIRRRLQELPLQSPGVCAYLAIKGDSRSPYLRFHLPGSGELCRLLVLPGTLSPQEDRDGWQPARLIAPMDYRRAVEAGVSGQRAYLDQILAESWWRNQVSDFKVLATRLPAEWGEQYHLYRDSMNPVMTSRFMRAGRLAHRSPYVRGLYLAGSSTHPGQWVSFCAMSGIMAADCVCEDFR